MATKQEIPNAPKLLPPDERKRWLKIYATAFKEAQNDFPEDTTLQKQTALREANRMLRVHAPEDYEEAMKIPGHLVKQRFVDSKGVLRVTTIDGKKYHFEVPPKVRTALAEERQGEKKRRWLLGKRQRASRGLDHVRTELAEAPRAKKK
jgi:hypothetical protein